MCGIGAISSKNVSQTLATREFLDMCYLSFIAHRGKHSNGIAWVEDGKLHKVTALGAPGETAYVAASANPSTQAVIGHVRLASQGAPTLKNAHPFFNEDQSLALIHNGHLGNTDHMKKLITTHKLTSDTDSELILHIFEEKLAVQTQTPEGFAKAMLDTADECMGSKNVIILMKDGTIVAYADSALCMQKSDESIRLASVPTTKSKSWTSLAEGTAVVIQNGVLLEKVFRQINHSKLFSYYNSLYNEIKVPEKKLDSTQTTFVNAAPESSETGAVVKPKHKSKWAWKF